MGGGACSRRGPAGDVGLSQAALPLEIDVQPSFGWYESVGYEEPGKPVRWLRLDGMMNAIASFAINTVAYMSGARLGLRAEGVDGDGSAPAGC